MMKLLTCGRAPKGGSKMGHTPFAEMVCQCGCGKRWRTLPRNIEVGRRVKLFSSRECRLANETRKNQIKQRYTMKPCAWCYTPVIKNNTCSHRCASLLLRYGSQASRIDAYDDTCRTLYSNDLKMRRSRPNKSLFDTFAGDGGLAKLTQMRALYAPSGIKGCSTAIKKPTIDEQMRTRGSGERIKTASMIRMARSGLRHIDIARHTGCAESTVSNTLRRSDAWRARSSTRLAISEYRKSNTRLALRSSLWPTEPEFIGHIAFITNGEAEKVVADGSMQRVDVFCDDAGGRYAIECKAVGHSAKADQCIGQAMRKAMLLNAVPVVCFPSDIRLTPEFLLGVVRLAEAYGLRICSEVNAAECVSIKNYTGEDASRSTKQWLGREVGDTLGIGSRSCKRCGAGFTYEIATQGAKRYCSKECHGA